MTANVIEQFFSHLPEGERISRLKEITEANPFFAAAHYSLLQELTPGSEEWKLQARKTALHFSPYQLAFLQNKVEEEVNTSLPQSEVAIEKKNVEELDGEEVSPEAEVPTMAPVLPEETENSSTIEIESKTNDVTEQENVKPGVTGQTKPATPVLPGNNDSAEGPLLFEPLHTSDYFASQGIKITDEMQPKDKLGKQLKSFTAWLQTMKKLNEAKLPATDSRTEQNIIKLAEKSNKEAEVHTEAMAEAYLIQGKPAKAIEIYEKLKLLNPDKSSFFAAKIKELQGNNL